MEDRHERPADFLRFEYQGKKHTTRREQFLVQLDRLIPWERLEERARPHYPKAGQGRQPYGLPVMLR